MVQKCPTYSVAPSVGVLFWYLEAIFLMRSLKANSFRTVEMGSLKMGTICSSCTDPVSPSDSTDLVDEEPELSLFPFPAGDFLGFRGFFLVDSSNNEGPKIEKKILNHFLSNLFCFKIQMGSSFF